MIESGVVPIRCWLFPAMSLSDLSLSDLSPNDTNNRGLGRADGAGGDALGKLGHDWP